jgi:hypothetical protein
MINHARNLLMNVRDTAFNSSVVLEEIIDPAYVRKSVPSYLGSVRRVLFGEQPDRYMLNYRTRQLLQIVHSCELEQFVYDLDPRVTYSFDNDPTDNPNVFDLYVDQYQGSRNDLGIVGEPWSPDKYGQMLYQWDIQYVGGTTDVQLMRPFTAVSYTPSFTDNLSDVMDLPQAPIAIRHSNMPAKWMVKYLLKPTKDLGDILTELESLGPDLLQLFGVGTEVSRTEPMKTFYNLWKYHYALPYRLGAATLALAYRMDELNG